MIRLSIASANGDSIIFALSNKPISYEQEDNSIHKAKGIET